jgi:hypothetical protein
LRLGDGEDLDMVKLQLAQAGYSVADNYLNANKKPAFTQGERSPMKTSIDTKLTKVAALQSSEPSAFGNNGSF